MAKDSKIVEGTEVPKTRFVAESDVIKMREEHNQEMTGLLGRIKNLEIGFRTAAPRKVTDRVANVSVINGQPVTSWESEKAGKIKLRLLDGEKVEMPYIEWVQDGASRIKVNILSQTTEEVVKSDGYGKKIKPDTDEILAGTHVEYLVKSVKHTALVEIAEGELRGKQFEISTDYLNP